VTALYLYLASGGAAVAFASVRAALNPNRSDLVWHHVLTMLVGLVITWPVVLVFETIAWWREGRS
jgi:heme/copper-type cytochrome/quinol oxidase subunit 2